MLKKGVDYRVFNIWPFRRYQIIKGFKENIGIFPPNNEPIDTMFGTLSAKGILHIKKGFTWDGATGAVDTTTFMRGSCIHDWGCNAVNNDRLPAEPYRRLFDDLLEKHVKNDAMNPYRADYVHWAVRTWGKIKHGIK